MNDMVTIENNDKIRSMNVYQRIMAVMAEVSYVKKDAKVSGYKAVSHDQVVSAARNLFVKYRILIRPSQVSGELEDREVLPTLVNGETVNVPSKMRMFKGVFNIDFVNVDKFDEYCRVDGIHAHALDNGDKAPGKALTYATKSAVLKILWLETGENDESRADQGPTITAMQIKNIESKVSKLPEGRGAEMLKQIGITEWSDLLKVNYNDWLSGINGEIKK